MHLAGKRADLRRRVARLGGVVVAYSGGMDSTLVAAVAHDVLGAASLAVTAASPAVPVAELEAAVRLAEERGWAHRVVPAAEGGRRGHLRNGRCCCRADLLGVLEPIARARRATVATGTNADDVREQRPGLPAGVQRGMRAPLAEAGLSRAEVRALSADLGLPAVERPAPPCATGAVPQAGRGRTDRAQALLAALGFGGVRVRVQGELARIEVPAEQVTRVVALREPIAARLATLGFPYVTLDLAGGGGGSPRSVGADVRGAG